MAEVLSVVASGIAVGTLAGKLAHSCMKLKDYWDQVKDAPDDISFLLREVDSLKLILAHISEGKKTPNLAFDNFCLQQSLQLCEDGVKELEGLVDELAGKIEAKEGWKKKTGSLKIVLRKDELKRIKDRMKSAIRLLSLAYQCHTSAMMQLQPEIIVARVTAHMQTNALIQVASTLESSEEDNINHLKKKPRNADSQDIVGRHYKYWISSAAWVEFLLGSFKYRYHTELRKGRPSPVFEAKYSWPSWISHTTYFAEGCCHLNTWQVKYRGYRVLPKVSPFLIAIKYGDILTVQKMLSNKTAFVTDRSGEYEESVLHIVCQTSNVNMLNLLLTEGADPVATNIFYSLPLNYLLWQGHHLPPERLEAIRALLQTEAGEDLENSLQCFAGEVSVLRYLQNQVYPPYFERDLDYRMDIAIKNSYATLNPASAIEVFELFFCVDGRITIEMALWEQHDEYGGETALHAIARLMKDWMTACYRGTAPSEIKDKMNKDALLKHFSLLRRFIEAGALLHARDGNGNTPLAILLSRNYYPVDYNDFILNWVTSLYESGIDLQNYGNTERQLGTFNRRLNCKYSRSPHRLARAIVKYGPQPCDWKIWLREPSDRFAGHFWKLIEQGSFGWDDWGGTMRSVPGGWQDDLQDPTKDSEDSSDDGDE